MSAVVEFELNEKKYILERVKTKSGNPALKLNGATVIQSEIDSLLGSYEVFSSAFLAGNFMKLDEADRYAVINSIFTGDTQKLYIDMVGEKVAKEFPLGSTDIETIKKQIKAIDTEINNIQMQKLAKSAIIEESSQMMKPEPTVSNELLEQIRLKLEAHDKIKPTSQTLTVDSSEIALVRGQISAAELDVKRHATAKPDRSNLDTIATMYKQALVEQSAVEHGEVCVTCHRAFDPTQVEAQKISAATKVQSLLLDGKNEKEKFENALVGWTQEYEKRAKVLQDLQIKLNALQDAQINSGRSASQHLEKELSLWQERRNAIQEELNEASSKYREYQVLVNQFDERQDRIAAIKLQLQEYDAKLMTFNLGDLEKVKEALGPKGVEFLDIQNKVDAIKAYLPEDVEIQLILPNKTNDGFKKVFNVLQNGVSYNWLSKGLKKILDVHISEMIASKSGIGIICIDDLESLTSSVQLKDTNVQLFQLTAKDVDFNFDPHD